MLLLYHEGTIVVRARLLSGFTMIYSRVDLEMPIKENDIFAKAAW